MQWLTSAGRPALLSIALAASAMLVFTWWVVLPVYLVAVLLVVAARARNAVVVETFADHRAGQADPSGTATLLANRLAEMRQIYRGLEADPTAARCDRPTDAGVQLEDAGDVLRSAFTTQSNLTVGVVTLPVGAIMALIGRLAQAPRLRGALHEDHGKLIMTAELGELAWREEGSPQEKDDIIQRLAYRIFADLSLQGQAEWPATRHWLDALASRRASQRVRHDRWLHLRQAESALTQALADDQNFYLATYDLAQVYRDLAHADRIGPEQRRGYLRAAAAIFERAMDIDPGHWEGYYGRALCRWELLDLQSGGEDRLRRLERVVNLCERALDLRPSRGAAAQIERLRAMAGADIAVTLESFDELGDAISTLDRACKTMLRQLMFTKLLRARQARAEQLEQLRRRCAQGLLNLAFAYGVAPPGHIPLRRVFALARMATRISDVDAEARAQLAQVAMKCGRDDLARDALRAATKIAPENARYWVGLGERPAVNAAEQRESRSARQQAELLMDWGDPAQLDLQDRIVAAYERAGENDDADRLRPRAEFCRRLNEGDLEALLNEEPDSWEQARIEVELAHREHAASQPGHAADLFAHAIALLGDADDVRTLRLRERLALALAADGRFDKATAVADEAVSLDPLSDFAWTVLGDVNAQAGDFARARTSHERALALGRDDPDLFIRLAQDEWSSVEHLGALACERKACERAREHLHHAIELCNLEELSPQRSVEWWRERRLRAHWLAARTHAALGSYEELPPHLWSILASVRSPTSTGEDLALKADCAMLLSHAQRRLQRYVEAEGWAGRALEAVSAAVDAGASLDASVTFRFDGSSDLTLRHVRVLALLDLAASHALRHGDLDLALEKIEEAEAEIDRSDASRASVHCVRGLVALADNKVQGAIDEFEEAVRIDPADAEYHVCLARALVARGDGASSRRASMLCERAKELSGPGHVDWNEADEVQQQIAVPFATPNGRPAIEV